MQPEFLLFDNVGLCGHCIVTDPSPLMPPQVIYLNNLKALVRLLVVCVQKRMNNCSVWVNLVHFLGQNPFSLVWWISHNGRQSIWYALCINKASTRFRLRMVCVHVHWHLWASKYTLGTVLCEIEQRYIQPTDNNAWTAPAAAVAVASPNRIRTKNIKTWQKNHHRLKPRSI